MKLTDQILAHSFTKSDALHKLYELELYLNNRIFKSGKGEDSEQQSFNPFFSSLSEEFLNQFTPSNIATEFRKSEKEIAALPVMTIYTPSLLDRNDLQSVGEKVREDFGKDVLLDLRVNPDLLAGCAIVWEGKYLDFSLQSRWGEVEKIIERRLASASV